LTVDSNSLHRLTGRITLAPRVTRICIAHFGDSLRACASATAATCNQDCCDLVSLIRLRSICLHWLRSTCLRSVLAVPGWARLLRSGNLRPSVWTCCVLASCVLRASMQRSIYVHDMTTYVRTTYVSTIYVRT